MNCLTKKKEFVMYYAKEITGHDWCVFCAKTAIMLYEGKTWEWVMEFARAKNLANREYCREDDVVVLY